MTSIISSIIWIVKYNFPREAGDFSVILEFHYLFMFHPALTQEREMSLANWQQWSFKFDLLIVLHYSITADIKLRINVWYFDYIIIKCKRSIEILRVCKSDWLKGSVYDMNMYLKYLKVPESTWKGGSVGRVWGLSIHWNLGCDFSVSRISLACQSHY